MSNEYSAEIILWGINWFFFGLRATGRAISLMTGLTRAAETRRNGFVCSFCFSQKDNRKALFSTNCGRTYSTNTYWRDHVLMRKKCSIDEPPLGQIFQFHKVWPILPSLLAYGVDRSGGFPRAGSIRVYIRSNLRDSIAFGGRMTVRWCDEICWLGTETQWKIIISVVEGDSDRPQ